MESPCKDRNLNKKARRYSKSTITAFFLGIFMLISQSHPFRRPPKPFFFQRGLVFHSKPLKTTGGASVVLKNLFVGIGANTLVDDLSWKIMPNERWAIVGPNGCGKSSLLKALTRTDPDLIMEGTVEIMKSVRMGYLEQTAVSGITTTVKEEVTSRMVDYFQAYKELNQTKKCLDPNSKQDIVKLELAQAKFEKTGGYKTEARIAKVLKGLGFSEKHYYQTCDTFSGGWQMRIALARLLLSDPTLLVLDEPSNHLDAAARKWLANYIHHYKGTVLLVSHDLELLRFSVNSIAELTAGKFEFYKSMSHAKYLVERKSRIERVEAERISIRREIDRMQAFVSRMGAKASKASQAQDRIGKIKKLELKLSQTEAINPLMKKRQQVKFADAPPCGDKPLQLLDATIGYQGKILASEVNLFISRGMRAVVRGPNGSGKSTLLKALVGSIPLLHGSRLEDDRVCLGLFSQDLAQELPQDMTAVNYVTTMVRQHTIGVSDQDARSIMGALGLSGDKAMRLIGDLSGGEKARVALATFCLSPHNILLLDEPTNHLDTHAIESLVAALNRYQGTVIVVSHDKPFCQALKISHVAIMHQQTLTLEERGLSDSDWTPSSIHIEN